MAAKSNPLNRLRGALRAVVDWLSAENIPGIIIGGVAASLLGRPRVTRDVDATVWLDEDSWPHFLASAQAFAIVPRAPEQLEHAQQHRVMLLRHSPSGVDVDVSLGALPFELEAINRAKILTVAGLRIPVSTPEDLIVMKAIARRDRDIADIEAVLDAQPNLDLRRIRSWVRQFAEVLEMPEIMDDLEKMLVRYEKESRR